MFDYDTRGVPKDYLEPDAQGKMCQQTIYSRAGDAPNKVRVVLEGGKVTRVGLSAGVECVVKTYGTGKEPTVKRWAVQK